MKPDRRGRDGDRRIRRDQPRGGQHGPRKATPGPAGALRPRARCRPRPGGGPDGNPGRAAIPVPLQSLYVKKDVRRDRQPASLAARVRTTGRVCRFTVNELQDASTGVRRYREGKGDGPPHSQDHAHGGGSGHSAPLGLKPPLASSRPAARTGTEPRGRGPSCRSWPQCWHRQDQGKGQAARRTSRSGPPRP